MSILNRVVNGAITAIYTPFVESTAVSFEMTPPRRDEILHQRQGLRQRRY
jgi:L-amino acid N-acyltransferase YncA